MGLTETVWEMQDERHGADHGSAWMGWSWGPRAKEGLKTWQSMVRQD